MHILIHHSNLTMNDGNILTSDLLATLVFALENNVLNCDISKDILVTK